MNESSSIAWEIENGLLPRATSGEPIPPGAQGVEVLDASDADLRSHGDETTRGFVTAFQSCIDDHKARRYTYSTEEEARHAAAAATRALRWTEAESMTAYSTFISVRRRGNVVYIIPDTVRRAPSAHTYDRAKGKYQDVARRQPSTGPGPRRTTS